LKLGAYVSFSGIATFKNAHDVREAALKVPLERTLIETDCPYLAPIPMRGRRNEPAFLPHVSAFLANLHGLVPEDFAEQADDNFFTLFKRAAS
jgi:TatD DNase family protein